jgi:DNA-binding NtrC family response regulator
VYQSPGKPTINACVLAVLPDSEDRKSLSDILRDSNWALRLERNLESAIAALNELRVRVVLTDSRFADGGCWKDLLRHMQMRSGAPPLVVSDRLADEKLWAEALNIGAYDVLAKPFDGKEVLHVLDMAARHEERVTQATSSANLPAGMDADLKPAVLLSR